MPLRHRPADRRVVFFIIPLNRRIATLEAKSIERKYSRAFVGFSRAAFASESYSKRGVFNISTAPLR